MLTRPPLPPRLAPLPEPVFLDPFWRPMQTSRFMAEAYSSAVQARWPGQAQRRAESWFRGPHGLRFCAAATRLLGNLCVEPQAWIGYVLATLPKQTDPYAPDILLAEDFVAKRIGGFRNWRTADRFQLPCQTLGGRWAIAYEAWLQVRARHAAIEAEIRGAAIAGHTGDEVVSAIVSKHLPDWENLYSRIETKAAALDTRAKERVSTGEFIWVSLLK